MTTHVVHDHEILSLSLRLVAERHTDKRKFRELLRFSKEVQVYQNVIHSMMIYDEKRYPAACVEPPVPRWVQCFRF